MALSEEALDLIKEKIHSKKFLSPEARTHLHSTNGSVQKELARCGIFRVESDQDAVVVANSLFREMNRCFQQSGWHVKLDPSERAFISSILQSLKAYRNLVDTRIQKELENNPEKRISDEACLAGNWEPGSPLDKRQDKLMAALMLDD